MVKVTYTEAFGDYGQLETTYDMENLDLSTSSRRRAAYEDGDGDSIVLSGEDFRYRRGELRGGTVEKVQFDGDGNVLMTIAGGEFGAKAASNALLGNNGIRGFLQFLYSADDKLLGSDRSDIIYGAGGHDRLTGGLGNDWFLFGHGDGKDVVTDFDAAGGPGAQDLIRPFSEDYEVKDAGDDTVIDFGNGDTLTLLGIDSSEISAEDFMVFT